MEENSKIYPKYYKRKDENTFVKRVDDATGYHVQLIGYTNGDFVNHHQKKHWGSAENFDKWLSDFTECTQEEYEVMVSQYSLKVKENANTWLNYRTKKLTR